MAQDEAEGSCCRTNDDGRLCATLINASSASAAQIKPAQQQALAESTAALLQVARYLVLI